MHHRLSVTCTLPILLFAACADTPVVETDADTAAMISADEDVVERDPTSGRCSTPSDDDPADAALAPLADDAALSGTVTIPVVFHVIRELEGGGRIVGNISKKRIKRQIAVLNDAYSGTRYRFELRRITRTTNNSWYSMAHFSQQEVEAKLTLHRGGPGTLNLYSAMMPSDLGWATWPWDYDALPKIDGVVIRWTTTPSGRAGRFTLGDTATHEVGHWIGGLLHTFEPRGKANGCVGGDLVADTNAERSAAFHCPTNRDTCPDQAGDDPIHNFMDYTDDSCMNKFTAGQRSRMNNKFDKYRASSSGRFSDADVPLDPSVLDDTEDDGLDTAD
jgi:pregnancy-associated plasma protein-A